MARDVAVGTVCDGVLAPWASRSATPGLASTRRPAAAGTITASIALMPTAIRLRNAAGSPVVHRWVSSGAVAAMIETATIP